MENMYQNKTVSDLIEYISERLQNPVLLETTAFELLAYSGNYQVLDDVRKNTILGKKAPTYIIECLKENKVVEAIEHSHTPIRIPSIEEIGFSKRVAVCIRVDGKPVAYLWVQETTTELTPDDFDFLQGIVKEIAKSMEKAYVTRKVDDRFFSKLLDGHYTNEKTLLLEAEMYGIKLPSEYVVMLFYATDQEEMETIKLFVRPYCMYENKSSFYYEYEKQLVVIIGKRTGSGESLYTMAKHLIHMIEKRRHLKEKGLLVGIGNTGVQFNEVRKHYLEALEVITIHNSFKQQNLPLCYKDLGIYRLLSVVHKTYSEEEYYNEALFTLKSYDIQNQTELVGTLEAFLTCNCKHKETADVLFVHPNTLSYRLKRIVELTQIDLEDVNQRTLLYIDLLLQKYRDE